MLWRDSDFLSLDDFNVSWSDDTLLSSGLGERGSDEGYRAGTTGRLLLKFVGRGGVLGATGGGCLIDATRWLVGGKVVGCSAVSTVVGRSRSLCFWMSGPMWLMWLKFVGADINFRRSDPLLLKKIINNLWMTKKSFWKNLTFEWFYWFHAARNVSLALFFLHGQDCWCSKVLLWRNISITKVSDPKKFPTHLCVSWPSKSRMVHHSSPSWKDFRWSSVDVTFLVRWIEPIRQFECWRYQHESRSKLASVRHNKLLMKNVLISPLVIRRWSDKYSLIWVGTAGYIISRSLDFLPWMST